MTETTGTHGSTFRLWKKLSRNRFGTTLFSVGAVARAPYFATVLPSVREVRPGFSEVAAPRWFGIRNHLGTFHAIAACNVAELAMGLAMESSVPTTHRWVPKAMQTRYLAKADTGLRARASLSSPIDATSIGDGADVIVSVAIVDSSEKEVVHCDITCWVTPKK